METSARAKVGPGVMSYKKSFWSKSSTLLLVILFSSSFVCKRNPRVLLILKFCAWAFFSFFYSLDLQDIGL